MTDTSKPLTLREALEKILLHAQKLEDEIWWDDKVSPNKRIQEIIFHASEALAKEPDEFNISYEEQLKNKEIIEEGLIQQYNYCVDEIDRLRKLLVAKEDEGKERIVIECPTIHGEDYEKLIHFLTKNNFNWTESKEEAKMKEDTGKDQLK